MPKALSRTQRAVNNLALELKRGREWPDALFVVSIKHNVDADRLALAYDAHEGNKTDDRT